MVSHSYLFTTLYPVQRFIVQLTLAQIEESFVTLLWLLSYTSFLTFLLHFITIDNFAGIYPPLHKSQRDYSDWDIQNNPSMAVCNGFQTGFLS